MFIDRRGDDATPHLLWKDDSNARGARTTIFLQRLRADGLGLEGAPKPLLSNDPAGWEGPLVEVSSLVLDVSISAAFRLHLDCISAASRPHFCCASRYLQASRRRRRPAQRLRRAAASRGSTRSVDQRLFTAAAVNRRRFLEARRGGEAELKSRR